MNRRKFIRNSAAAAAAMALSPALSAGANKREDATIINDPEITPWNDHWNSLEQTVAVSDAVPRPEHPRPDLFRDNWMTLNGEWQFEIDEEGDGESRGLTYDNELKDKIIVPFCPESILSGIGLGNTRKLIHVWYRRTFEVPDAMLGKRIRIHFGGVDYKAWVFVNGQFAGEHTGGSVGFNFEITKLLRVGENEVVVKVYDNQWSGLQPRGKQANGESWNVFYTRTTGIWQAVWLEAVGSSFIERMSLTPDPDHSRVLIELKTNGSDESLTLKAEAFAENRLVGSEISSGPNMNQLVLNLKEKRLWHPGLPFLYDLKLTLFSGDRIVDELKSYFGLRKVSINGRRILINDKPVFQRLILDQGFYPEGIWTAPSDEALRKDIEFSMACGYNGARLHQKVFEPRFLYWADKLGYIVWGEYPDAGFRMQPEGYSAVANEWIEVLQRDRNHPSIIGWCPFNEQPEPTGELQQTIWNITKAIDPTRPALETSGWTHTLPQPEVRDMHDYTADPVRLRERWMDYFYAQAEGPYPPLRYYDPARSMADRGVPFMISEVGGIGWATEGGWAYGQGPTSFDEFYTRYKGTIDAMLDNPNLFGFCYTQLTDIEQEKNGLYYYDRKPKFDVQKLYEITSRQAAYEREEPQAPQPVIKTIDAKWKVLVGAAPDGKLNTPYRYVTEKPAYDWMKPGFDDTSWDAGLSKFSNNETTGTKWETNEIYCRKTFVHDGSNLSKGSLILINNGPTDVYLNGQKILSAPPSRVYHMHMLTDELNRMLRKGLNTLAIHSRKERPAQYLDLAILVE